LGGGTRKPEPMGRLARALRWGGGIAGGFVHPALAAPGSALGGMLSRWLGAGDYTVSNNSIVNGSGNIIPSMHDNSLSTVIRHKEYLGDVITSGSANTFTVASYPINPGMISRFRGYPLLPSSMRSIPFWVPYSILIPHPLMPLTVLIQHWGL